MNCSRKFIAIILITSSATLAQSGTGVCTAGACDYCDKTGADKYCTGCWYTPMSGAGINRKCSGGTAITGCKAYQTTDDTASGKVYCALCNEEKFYFKKNGATKDLDTCVYCDLKINYFDENSGDCKPPNVVAGCTQYSSTSNACSKCGGPEFAIINKNCEPAIPNCDKYSTSALECKECKIGFHLSGDKKTCVKNIDKCKTAKTGSETTKCSECMDKYAIKDSDDTCQAITVNNCIESPDDKPAECKKCADGYFLENSSTCSKITVANCRHSRDSKKAGECDSCLPNYFKKDDKTACTAMISCEFDKAVYKTTLQCYKCNNGNSTGSNWYATDAKGDAKLSIDGDNKWEQVCTKASKIIALTMVSLTIMFSF